MISVLQFGTCGVNYTMYVTTGTLRRQFECYCSYGVDRFLERMSVTYIAWLTSLFPNYSWNGLHMTRLFKQLNIDFGNNHHVLGRHQKYYELDWRAIGVHNRCFRICRESFGLQTSKIMYKHTRYLSSFKTEKRKNRIGKIGTVVLIIGKYKKIFSCMENTIFGRKYVFSSLFTNLFSSSVGNIFDTAWWNQFLIRSCLYCAS